MKEIINKYHKIDYLIIITGKCYPIKSEVDILSFINDNKNKSFFIDFSLFYKDLIYIDEKTKEKINFPFGKLDFFSFFEKSINHHWFKWMHQRVYEENLIYYLINKVYSFIYFKKYKENLWNRKNWFFSNSKEIFEKQLYSEWYFSTQNFFSINHVKQYIDYFDRNKKRLKKFKNIYAPDEKFWISIAKWEKFDNVIYDFKPTGYHCAIYTQPIMKNNNFYYQHFFTPLKLDSLKDLKNVLFIRHIDAKSKTQEIINYIEKTT